MQKCNVEKQHDITMFSVFTTQITQPTTDNALLQTYVPAKQQMLDNLC